MQVTFKNTGMVESADIRFDGLTVIAGENDTGKSTIGKLMFSIIKTFNRYERDARAYRMQNIDEIINDYYFKFQKNIEAPTLYELAKTFLEDLKKVALELVERNTKSKKEIEAAVSRKTNTFAETLQGISGSGINLEEIKDRVSAVILKKPSKEEIFKRAFGKYASAVLNGEVFNKFSAGGNYSIDGKEGKASIFEISGTDRDVEVQLKDKLYIEDATFIESPILLNLSDNIRFSKTEFDRNGEPKKQAELLEKAYAPEYMKDLLLKLTERVQAKDSSKIEAAIRDIIKGKFYYDHRKREFVFEKENQSFKGVSIASGIKQLGVLGILSRVGFLDKKSLLILDEPENHVHPQWQIKLAEILVQAVEDGCNVLLTSHSPYFIEALKVHSNYSDIKSKTAFYLSEKTKTGFTSNIIDVTDDVSPIFELLAEPYETLEDIQSMDDETVNNES